MDLFETLNRIDDSLVESKRVVKKKKLTENSNDYGNPEDWEELDSSETMDDERNWEPLTLWKNLKTNKYVIILGDFTPWEGYANVETDNEEDAYSEFNAYLNEPYYNDDYDDVMEDVTESLHNSSDVFYLSLYNKDGSNFEQSFSTYKEAQTEAKFAMRHNPYVTEYIIYDSKWRKLYHRNKKKVLFDANKDLTEGRNNPYWTPYGYRDAAKVLNGKAPQYYWHLKEIEMDQGDGIKLARYAMRKGLPVMVDKNSDPDYPEFAIKGEYHWNDYFYPYPTAHEEDLVAWDGKIFVEQQLTESCEYTVKR